MKSRCWGAYPSKIPAQHNTAEVKDTRSRALSITRAATYHTVYGHRSMQPHTDADSSHRSFDINSFHCN